MRYQQLGRSGLKVSRICLGSNNFGSQIDGAGSVAIIRKAIDLGINLIDTANIYTDTESEKIIGKAIEGYRDQVIIATKVGMDMGEGPNQSGLSRHHILWQVQESLKRLATDYIDIYYLHRFDPETPLEETLRTMDDLVREGKVRYVACSNFAARQIAKADAICDRLGLEKFVAVQPPYNLLNREAEKELLPFCHEEGLGVLNYSPLMGGFLTGKYSKNTAPPSASRATHNPRFWERVNKERNFLMLEKLRNVAEETGISLRQLAVAWILKNPTITGTILGASSTQQVEENYQISDLDLADDVYRKLNEITSH
jgi:aryl-alcohol dehydrogenase-like predicted oxidoreductase